VGESESIIVNVVTKPYDYKQPDEYRLDAHENHIPYVWARKDG
jgi:dTDP-4-dehydrorhamnose 3,5-epimerase